MLSFCEGLTEVRFKFTKLVWRSPAQVSLQALRMWAIVPRDALLRVVLRDTPSLWGTGPTSPFRCASTGLFGLLVASARVRVPVGWVLGISGAVLLLLLVTFRRSPWRWFAARMAGVRDLAR